MVSLNKYIHNPIYLLLLSVKVTACVPAPCYGERRRSVNLLKHNILLQFNLYVDANENSSAELITCKLHSIVYPSFYKLYNYVQGYFTDNTGICYATTYDFNCPNYYTQEARFKHRYTFY